MDVETFLKTVVTTAEGWFCLATLSSDEGWLEQWFKWPDDLTTIVATSTELAPSKSVYFTAHLFGAKRSQRSNVLPSRTIQADLDNAAVTKELQPTVLVETSPGRHQGYWIMRDKQSVTQLEQLSRQLTYAIPDCDRGCWQLGHKMRLPGTLNHKYVTPHEVKIVSSSLLTFAKLPVSNSPTVVTDDWAPTGIDIGPRELFARVKANLPSKVVTQYDKRQPDRSEALWFLMMSCFRVGLVRDQVFALAKASANNKFADSKYNADRDLARDVIRAERAAKTTSATSVRQKIQEVRRSSGTTSDKKFVIAAIVKDNMQQSGNFVSTNEAEYFLREDTGRPIPLARHSDWLDSFLEDSFGLNATEVEQRFTVANLQTHSREHGRKGVVARLSYYDDESNTIFLHTGRRDVIAISENGINYTTNGSNGVLFPWSNSNEPFQPDIKQPLPFQDLFEGCFDNVIDLTKPQAAALMQTWFYFLFFRDSVISRPLIALFGQPGAGKSTLFRKIYALLYGPRKALNSITNENDFDFAVSNDPLVVFDNVDTWVAWLPDKLALSASTSDLTKRKLYTDLDTVMLNRQAMVGLTAHNPRFRREDIVDRLIILTFERLKVFLPETEMLHSIVKSRDALWGGIVNDLVKVLQQPLPRDDEIPSFRINDFARVGLRIARALNYAQDFQQGLDAVRASQVAFNLEEEDVLVDALKAWLSKYPSAADKYHSPNDLWSTLMLLAKDETQFRKQFPRSLTLARKLWSLQQTLKTKFNVDYSVDDSNTKLWRIWPK